MQGGGLAFEPQDCLAGSQLFAAGAERPGGAQAAQFAHAQRFLGAAQHHGATRPEFDPARPPADAESKGRRIAKRYVVGEQGL